MADLINSIEAKCVCGNATFKFIKNANCGTCKHNSAWFEDEDRWVSDEVIINKYKLERNCVQEEGLCDLSEELGGSAYGEGCDFFSCSKCGKLKELYAAREQIVCRLKAGALIYTK